MKKIILPFGLAIALLGGLFAFSFREEWEGENEENESAEQATYAGIQNFWGMMRQNVNTGKFEESDYYNAVAQYNQMGTAKSLGLSWTALGPDNIGGRVRALLIEKKNPNHILAGGVSGGLWISNDAGKTWSKHPQADSMKNICVTSLCQTKDGDIYMGTGELVGSSEVSVGNGGSIGNIGFPGYGVYKSTDNGTRFTHLTATIPTSGAQWKYIDAIAADNLDNDLIYVATHLGLYKSTDGGATFAKPTGVAGSSWCTDVKTNKNGDVICFLGSTASSAAKNALVSKDHGATFSAKPITTGAGFNRVKFAYAPSDPNYVYCGAANSAATSTAGVFKSTDGGETWSQIGPSGASTFNPYNQAYFSMSIAVNPANKNRIYTGGLDLYMYDQSGWVKSSLWYAWEASPVYVHADHHAIVFHPTNPDIFYMGTDGGVSECTNARAGVLSFQTRNKGLGVTQLYGLGAGVSGDILGGAQDNGSMYNNYSGIYPTYYSKVKGGDGFQAAISHVNPQALFATTYGDANGTKPLARSLNGGSSFTGILDVHIDANDGATGGPDDHPDEGGYFVTRLYLWEKLGNYTSVDDSLNNSRLYMPTQKGVWVAVNALTTSPTWYKVSAGNIVTGALSMKATEDGNTLFVGTDGGDVYRIDSLNTTYPVNYSGNFTATPEGRQIRTTKIYSLGRAITGIAIDPTNSENILISSAMYGASSYVTRITNAMSSTATGTTTAASAQGTGANALPIMPCYDVAINPTNASQAIVATELGVFSCSNIWSGTPIWANENNHMPNVPVMQLQFSQNKKGEWWLFAATHGRGAFYTRSLCGSCDSIALNNVNLASNNLNANENSLNIYPNPATDQSTLTITATKADANAMVRIYSLNGTLEYQAQNAISVGTNNLVVNVNGFASGVHLVQVQMNGQTYVKKLIKQ
jgi:photosystem II stability/assembly factor-like uncharacterized protein